MQKMIAAARSAMLIQKVILVSATKIKALPKKTAVVMVIFSPYRPTHLYLQNSL